MDLSPARWIWFPSTRTLPNTFVLFRRPLTLTELPTTARGCLTADSRYRLTVNGQRVQWGPAPCDPRSLEVDPVDLAPYLQLGPNVIGIEVLFYGHGEGTWVGGKPGLIFSLQVDYANGQQEQIISNAEWSCLLDRAHRPGQYQRWYLRALQEEFDARLHPAGWDQPGFSEDDRWLPALELSVPADKPAACSLYRDYLFDTSLDATQSALYERSIPLLREVEVPAQRLADAGIVHWQRDPADWFEMRTPGSLTVMRDLSIVHPRDSESWQLQPASQASEGHFLTFEWSEQLVGWPYVTIEAPAGTIVEVICQEAHDPAGDPWLDTHFYSWSRFICRDGRNTFETFDFESLRWLQLHIHGTTQPVTIWRPGVRRRLYDWPHPAQLTCSEPALQRVFDAGLNTLNNSAQETCVDGMGRERQQYSGDGGHQLLAIRLLHGETRLPRRFLTTYRQGQTHEGYFLDSWPAYDRLARIAQRQTGMSPWGPLLDHGVGFVFDTWYHYLHTGDREAVSAPYHHFARFIEYLAHLRDQHGLLPVEHLGVPAVWIDHDAYQQQRHKQCAFTLYAAAMLQHALAPLAEALDDPAQASIARQLGHELLQATIRRFWSEERRLFVNNLPWIAEEGTERLCDRSLATALLFGQYPDGTQENILRVLADCPPELGISYPANAGWRYQALAHGGRIDRVLDDLRQRWATMDSVLQNNTLGEMWHIMPDSTYQWSHCPVAPLFIAVMDIAGIRPIEPAFARYTICPQLGDLAELTLTAYTPHGPLHFHAHQEGAGHRIQLSLPPAGEGVLLAPHGTQVNASVLTPDPARSELQRFALEPDRSYSCWLSAYDAPVQDV